MFNNLLQCMRYRTNNRNDAIADTSSTTSIFTCTSAMFKSQYMTCIETLKKRCFPTVYAADELVTQPTQTQGDEKRGKTDIVVTDEEVKQFIQNESGMDRLRRMYSLSPKSKLLSMDISKVLILTFGSFVFGTINPVHSGKFRPTIAGKIGQRLIVGFKVAGLMGMWSLSAQSISTYRNRTNPLDFTPGGALMGIIVFRRHPYSRLLRMSALSTGIGVAMGILYTAALYYENETQPRQHFVEIKVLMEKGEIERPGKS